MVTSTLEASARKVREVPQTAQWVRSTPGEEAKAAGLPWTSAKPSAGTVSQATLCAPAARRQVAQWQMLAPSTGPSMRYRTAPQRHPPSMGSCMGALRSGHGVEARVSPTSARSA